jgi:hypothetical protein
MFDNTQSLIVPALIMRNCVFEKIHSISQNTGFHALINIHQGLPASILMEGCSFKFNFFGKGVLFASPMKKSRTYFLILPDQTFSEIYKNSDDSVKSNFSLISSLVQDQNKVGLVPSSNIYNNLFTFDSISGTFFMSAVQVTNVNIPQNIIFLSSSRLDSKSDFKIEKSSFTQITADTYLNTGRKF